MYCVACSNYKDGTCQIEKIYASGYLSNCPFLGKPEPIIAPHGANYQIMREFIRERFFKRVTVTPKQYPHQEGWGAQVMFSYDGKGVCNRAPFEPSLPLGAIWFGWLYAKEEIEGRYLKKLGDLLPYINMRIGFDYSVVEYGEIWETVKIPPRAPTSALRKDGKKTVVKKISRFVPSVNPDLLEITIPEKDSSQRGDQIDLFAI